MKLARHEFAAILVATTILKCGIECSAAVQSGPVEAWLTRLRSTELSVRVQAAYHPPATEEISTEQAAVLLKALNDKNSYVRRYVASALGEIRIDPKFSAPALVKALFDPDGNVRLHSAVALGKIGFPAITLMIERLAAHPDDDIAFGLSQCGVDIVEPLLAAVRKQRLRGSKRRQIPSKRT